MMNSFTKIHSELATKFPTTKILAVSKLQEPGKIRALHEQGQRLFGENYVQEALSKQIELKDLSIEWHLIGTLQSKKAKQVVGLFQLIHSVDSLKLAMVIDQVAKKKGIRQKILIQVNVADENTKGGFSEFDLKNHWTELCNLKNIEIQGLMTMPPLFEDPEKARPFFKKLRELRDQLKSNQLPLPHLSMGTSSDYLVAASEGATLVRLGTILFGARPA